MIIYVAEQPVGHNIRYLRRRKGISVRKLAEMTGIPYLTMYCIDNSTLRDIDYDYLVSLCKVFDVMPEDLIGRKLHYR